jgi:CheY-like chemotaxis protein
MNLNLPEFRNKHVLIVDDDLPSVRYYETILKSTGAEVTVFNNGRDFAEFLNLDGIDLDFVIMDYLIPFINGIDCIRLFRKKNRNTPVIMVTAYCSDQLRGEAFVSGCNDFILKPVFPETLVMLMEKYLVSIDRVKIN